MNKHFLLVALLLVLVCANSPSNAQAPNIVPVAPEAAALAKEVNYPITYNTGVANISVPLTEVKSGDLTLPIALSYHGGGFKTNERSTSVGLGFSLSCEIQITRTVNGGDDFETEGYIANSEATPYNPATDSYSLCDPSSSGGPSSYMFGLANGKDGMPDKFNYRLINKSGSFFFRKSGGAHEIVSIPYDNTIKITYYAGTDGQPNFRIIDSDGTIYTFEGYREQSIPLGSYTGPYTSWKCSKIENSTKTASFVFTWVEKSPVTTVSQAESITYTDYPDACGNDEYHTPDEIPSYVNYFEEIPPDYYPLSSPQITYNYFWRKDVVHLPYLDANNNLLEKSYPKQNSSVATFATTTTNAFVLSEISFRGGKATFSGTDQLNSITIKDAQQNAVQYFNFTQSYKLPANLSFAQSMMGQGFMGTLYLDKIEIRNYNKATGNYMTPISQTFTFQYAEKYCFGDHLKGKDAWGYVNDYTTDITSTTTSLLPISVPRQTVTQTVIKDVVGCADVDNISITFGNEYNTETPSLKASVGLLSRIVYPTGGYVDFQYEPNKYNATVTDYYMAPSDYAIRQGGGLRIKTITYFDGRSSVAAHQKYYRYGEHEEGTGLPINMPNDQTQLSTNYYKGYSYSHTQYNIKENGMTERIEQTVYEPASSQNFTYSDGASIYYTKVTEYNSDFGVETGKRVFTYYPPREFLSSFYTLSRIQGTNINVVRADLMGQQRTIEDYRYADAGFSLVHKKEFVYSKYSSPFQVRVQYAYSKASQTGGTPNSEDCDYDFWNSRYINCDYSERNGRYMTEHCDAYISGQYGIEVANTLVTQVNETIVREGITSTQSTQFFYDNPNYYQPSRIITNNSEGQQLIKTIKYAYDFTDPTYVSMKSNNMVSQPIEEILYNYTLGKEISRSRTSYGSIGISESQSFIAPTLQERSFNGQPLLTQLTLDKYDQYGNILQVTGKDKIPVSYLWGYNGLYPIAEIKGATYAQVSGTSSTTPIQTLLSTYDDAVIEAGVNERRNLFPSAMVSSFTHEPLVGVLGITDPSGSKTSFKYDYGNRLESVRDRNGDVIKAIEYNMLNSPIGQGNYPLFKTNVPQMETFFVHCPTTTPVTYQPYNKFVEGGKYVSGTNWYPDFDAAQELRSYAPIPIESIDCSNPAGEEVQLFSMGIYEAYLDLLRDGSVVYSKPFPNSFVTTQDYYTPVIFKVPPGEYVVSLRFERSNYNGRIRMTLFDGTNSIVVNTGDSITIAPGKTYSFNIYTQQ